MAGSVNKVILIGNLGQDPELRYTSGQIAVATLNIATTEYRTAQDGQKQEMTEWHRIVVWNKLAENCSKYLTKGRTIFVEGRLQTRSWDDKTSGQKRYATEIVAQNIQFLGGPNAGVGRDGGAARAPAASNNSNNSLPDFDLGPASNSSAPSSNDSSLMDDIPF